MIANIRQRWWTTALVLVTVLMAITLITISAIGVQRSGRIPATSTLILGTTATGMRSCNNDSFHIQYPATWTCILQYPGVELDDVVQEPSTIVQIVLPSGDNTPAQWVSNEFDQIKEQSGGSGFSAAAQPLQRSMSGETWIGNAAQLSLNDETIYVQVYATIHNQQAFVITLFSTGSPIDVTQQSVLGMILNSFQFT